MSAAYNYSVLGTLHLNYILGFANEVGRPAHSELFKQHTPVNFSVFVASLYLVALDHGVG